MTRQNAEQTEEERRALEDARPQYDRDIEERDRLNRTIFTIVASIATIAIPVYCLYLLMIVSDMPSLTRLGITIGIIAGLQLNKIVLRRTTVKVPDDQGLVSENAFGGKKVKYGAGWHPRFPWEDVNEKSHFSLEDITVVVKDHTVATEDSELKLEFLYRYRVRLKHLDIFSVRGETTVSQIFTGIFKGFYSGQAAFLDGDTARKGIKYLGQRARAAFDMIPPEDLLPTETSTAQAAIVQKIDERLGKITAIMGKLGQSRQTQEDNFGVDMLNTDILDADFPSDVQKARNAKLAINSFIEAAIKLAGFDPKTETGLNGWRDLKPAQQRIFIRHVQLQAGVQGIREEAIVYEGNPPPPMVTTMPVGQGSRGGH